MKLTIENASAPNTVPTIPPAPRRFSVARSRNPGSAMSYIPNSDSAKKTNSTPRKTFMYGSTLSSRKIDSRKMADAPRTTTMVRQ